MCSSDLSAVDVEAPACCNEAAQKDKQAQAYKFFNGGSIPIHAGNISGP